jgi:phosphoglycolate phosphatase-like HAD superfamily hydrolase
VDLDGPVLENSLKYHSLYSNLLGDKGKSLLKLEEYWNLKRDEISEREILRRTCTDEKIIAAYLENWKKLIESPEYLKKDKLQPGSKEKLQEWSKSVDVYLVTLRKNRMTLEQQLRDLDIHRFFKSILTHDQNDGTWKVKRDLMKPFVEESRKSYMIGDTEVDIMAGRALGCVCFAVTCGIRTRAKLETCKPDFFVGSLSEVNLEKS